MRQKVAKVLLRLLNLTEKDGFYVVLPGGSKYRYRKYKSSSHLIIYKKKR